MIGNDVVDLDDEETRSLHPRFDARVFSASELGALRDSRDPHRLRWLLWAAKESAYKLLRRTLPDLVFSPSRFVVRAAGPKAVSAGSKPVSAGSKPVSAGPKPVSAGSKTATVEASGHLVRVRYECGAGFVHCVAGYHGVDATLSEVAQMEEPLGDAGESVRRFAVRSIARHLAVDEDRLRVERAGRMPVVVHGRRPLPGTLSLSHHGRFVAFAWRGGEVGRVLESQDVQTAASR